MLGVVFAQDGEYAVDEFLRVKLLLVVVMSTTDWTRRMRSFSIFVEMYVLKRLRKKYILPGVSLPSKTTYNLNTYMLFEPFKKVY